MRLRGASFLEAGFNGFMGFVFGESISFSYYVMAIVL